MFEEIEAFIGVKMIDKLSYRLPELLIRPFSGFAQKRFQFGEHIFNRVQIGAVGWQVFDRRSPRFNNALNLCDPMRRQVVTDDDIAGF